MMGALKPFDCVAQNDDTQMLSSDLFAAREGAGKAGVKPYLAIAADAQRTRCAIAHSLPDPRRIRKAGRAAPDCDRSGRAAGAVRDRSFAPRPVRQCSAWRAWRALRLRLCLTQTHGDAKRMDCQFRAASGSGGAVLVRTGPEPRQNFQSTDIVALIARFSWFSCGASRDARTGAYAGTRAHIREGKPRTSELSFYIVTLHRVISSQAVLVRFSPEPTGSFGLESGGFARFSHILAGGYGALGADSTVLRGRGGVGFGVLLLGRGEWARGVVLELVDLGEIRGAGGNGGFLRFLLAAGLPVGRLVLEGSALGRGNQPFVGLCHLPVRLAARGEAGGCPIAQAPPCAPIAPSSAPSLLARQSGGISIRLPIGGSWPTRASGRQHQVGTIGSGWSCARPWADVAAWGRGEAVPGKARWGRPGLRRAGQASGGAAHVN